MDSFYRNGYVFFVLTYVCLFCWLYAGVADGYRFCLPPGDPASTFAVLAGVSGILTLAVYGRAGGSRTMRMLGVVTFLFGFLALLSALHQLIPLAGICA